MAAFDMGSYATTSKRWVITHRPFLENRVMLRPPIAPGHVAASSGVAGGEKSPVIACMSPSTDQGSVVSRMGTTSRISLNGALGGSGGAIVNSMKSYGAGFAKSDPRGARE